MYNKRKELQGLITSIFFYHGNMSMVYINLVLGLMVFNATFNNISAISWRSVLLVEETTDLPQVTDKFYHIMLYNSPWSRLDFTTSVVIGTDCIGSCKSNYRTITATSTPIIIMTLIDIYLSLGKSCSVHL